MASDTSKAWPWVWALVVIHGAMLIFGLGSKGLWLDEVMSITAATASWAELWRFFVGLPEQHPLYYLLARGWLSALGVSEVALRALSALFAVASVPVTFLFLKKLASSRVALAGTALLCFSPFWIFYGQEGRMYTLLIFLVVLSSWLWLDLLDRGAVRARCIAYWATATLAMYTHFFFGFVLLSHWVLGLVEQKRTLHRSRALIWAPILVVFAYLPWALLIMLNFPDGQGWKDWRHVVFAVPYTFIRFTIGYAQFIPDHGWQTRVLEMLAANVVILGGALVGFGGLAVAGASSIWHSGRSRRIRVLTLLAIPVAAPLALSPVMILSGERYFMVIFPIFLLVVADGFFQLVRRRGIAQWLGFNSGILAAAVMLAGLHGYYFNRDFGKESWREVAADLRQSARDSEAIVVVPGYAANALRYYLPTVGGLPEVLEWESADVSSMDTVWVAVSRMHTVTEVMFVVGDSFHVVERRLYRQGVGIHLLLLGRFDADALPSVRSVELASTRE
jgi:mannosyltransferase